MPEQMVGSIESELHKVEETFLASRERWPRPGWVEEYIAAFVRLRELYEYIEMEVERQDLAFQAEREVRILHEHCLWLARRIGREVFFRTQLRLEQELRAQSAATAYDVYLRLVEVQGLEKEFERLTDGQLAEQLLSGRLDLYGDLGSPLVPE